VPTRVLVAQSSCGGSGITTGWAIGGAGGAGGW
jgi:hypothetical protein